MSAWRIKEANFIREQEMLTLESAGKPDRHLILSLSSLTFHLFVGGPEPKECTLYAKWGRDKILHVQSQGRFTKDHVFSMRDALFSLGLGGVSSAMHPFFDQVMEERDFKELPHHCEKCRHQWMAITRISNLAKTRGHCPNCGSERVLKGRLPAQQTKKIA